MRPLLKSVLSWFVFALGLVVGLCALVIFGGDSVNLADRSSGWYQQLLLVAGIGLLGLCFLSGSIAALRNRKRAAVIFAGFTPVAAFCICYPDAGYLVWHADGSGWFESPLPQTAIGLTALFFLPLFAALFLRRQKKRAAYLVTVAMLLAGVVFGMSRWTAALLPRLAEVSAFFLLFASFWGGTHKLGWPSLLQSRPQTFRGRTAALVLTCLAVVSLDIALTFLFAALRSSLFSPDCNAIPPFTQPESASQSVFTTRIIFVGRSINAWGPSGDTLHDELRDHPLGEWAIGVVQEKFWGLPSWEPRYVLLTDYIYWKGETYFIDGRRSNGLLTRALPIVSGGIGCSRTRPAQEAIVDLRLLHEAPPAGGTRLIGYARLPQPFVSGFAPPTPIRLAAGAQISVAGPTGTRIITTDQSGLYQLDDLPLGDYTLRLVVPGTETVGFFSGEESGVKIHVAKPGVLERNFEVFWNGRIEGHVADDTGRPAHALVELLTADRSRLPGNVNYFLQTDATGSYQVHNIPPGRYIVRINPYGASDESPYNPQFYPSGFRSEDARVFQLAEGQEIKGVDFKLARLAERTAHARVTWLDGSPAKDALVCVAYEHTQDYETPGCSTQFKRTSETGEAVVHLYGHSKVRLLAEGSVEGGKTVPAGEYRSPPVESEADKMPDSLNLVLSTLQRH
jgi:hypothetical protein